MPKNIWKILGWTVFVLGVFVLLGFVQGAQNDLSFSKEKLDIEIQFEGENQFIDSSDVLFRLEKLGYAPDGNKLKEVSIQKVEEEINSMTEVKSAEVYKTIDGEFKIKARLRRPIVRIQHANGMNNYIDEDRNYMSLSSKYTAKVLIVTGEIDESKRRGEVANITNVNEKSDYLSDDVYALANFIDKNSFWKNQIQQAVVNKAGEFELTPLVGDHKIIFGTIDNMERKFKKLKIFYTEGLNKTDWNKYKTINLVYRNQIVCTKK